MDAKNDSWITDLMYLSRQLSKLNLKGSELRKIHHLQASDTNHRNKTLTKRVVSPNFEA